MLHAAGIEEASTLVVAIDEKQQATELVHHVSTNYPHVHIAARAIDRDHVYELYAAGANDIIRDYFDSAVRTGRSVFEALGMHAYAAERQAKAFVEHDKAAILALAEVYDPEIPAHENVAYVEKAKAIRAEQDEALRNGRNPFANRNDRGWTPPKL